jgi:hypothetical protein
MDAAILTKTKRSFLHRILIGSYLKRAPLIAGPPAALYGFNKYIRQHKSLVASFIVVLTVHALLNSTCGIQEVLRINIDCNSVSADQAA